MPSTHFTHPRTCGKDTRACRNCKTHRGLIRKYDLMLCRRCFRENAKEIGFTKVKFDVHNDSIVKSSLIISSPIFTLMLIEDLWIGYFSVH